LPAALRERRKLPEQLDFAALTKKDNRAPS
jgi:hypothetical protein